MVEKITELYHRKIMSVLESCKTVAHYVTWVKWIEGLNMQESEKKVYTNLGVGRINREMNRPQVYYCKQCERQLVAGLVTPVSCPYSCGGDSFWHESEPGAPCNRQGEEEWTQLELAL